MFVPSGTNRKGCRSSKLSFLCCITPQNGLIYRPRHERIAIAGHNLQCDPLQNCTMTMIFSGTSTAFCLHFRAQNFCSISANRHINQQKKHTHEAKRWSKVARQREREETLTSRWSLLHHQSMATCVWSVFGWLFTFCWLFLYIDPHQSRLRTHCRVLHARTQPM